MKLLDLLFRPHDEPKPVENVLMEEKLREVRQKSHALANKVHKLQIKVSQEHRAIEVSESALRVVRGQD